MHNALQELTSEDKRYAAVHLNETDETREKAIAEIKRWIQESDDLSAGIGKNDSVVPRSISRHIEMSLDEIQLRIH